jgi:hypothetical protein
MSLAFILEDWCCCHGYRAKPAVYLADGLDDLGEGEAHLVRFVSPSERAIRPRTQQTYTVEVFVNNELAYPLGTTPRSAQRLQAALIADTMERKAK